MLPIHRPQRHLRPLAAKLALSGLLLASLATPAHAGWFEKLFGKSDSTPATPAVKTDGKARIWRLHEFTVIQLAPREAGSEANQQPVAIDPEALRQQLAAIVIAGADREPLFDAGELAELIPPLTQALARATPADDILVLSSDRRGSGILGAPKALTARLFVQGGALQVIVNESRQDFYDIYRGTKVEPKFTFGSRSAAGRAQVQSVGASSRRADWLSIPMNVAGARKAIEAPAVPAPIGAAPAAVVPGPIGAAMSGAPLPAPAPAMAAPAAAVAVPAPMAAPAPAGPALSEPERRLETLKRLHSKGLITDEEYQEKRKEILKSL